MIEAEKWLDIAERADVAMHAAFLCNTVKQLAKQGDGELATQMYDRLMRFAPNSNTDVDQEAWWHDAWISKTNAQRVLVCCFLAAVAEAEDAD